MARGINKVILIGNCGLNPEIRQLPSGRAVANISLATSESWRDKNTGEQQTKTAWHRLVFYSPLAEIVQKYVRKGTQLFVEGSINYGQYEKEGITRYTTDIVVRNMELLGSRSDNINDNDNDNDIFDDDEAPF